MKTKFISSFAALIMSLGSYSQIKVFSGGSVTIGATTSPTANAVTHQIIGSKVAFPGTTSAATSAPLIVGQNAVSSSPGFAFLGDHQTGMSHPAASVLGFAISNSEKFRINSTGQLLNRNGAQNPNTPDYSWYSDPSTGMYCPTSGCLAFATGGTARLFMLSNGQLQSANSPHTAANPDYSWSPDSNTGIFNAATGVIGFSTGGTERARLNSSGRFLVGTTNDDGMISTKCTDYKAASFSVTLNSDWASPSSVTYANRANSGHYQINLNGTTKFYVAGQGWIYSDGNYLGSDKNIKDDIKSIDSAMAKVKKINGVLYKLKTEKQNPNIYGTAGEYMGVIAQDVEAVAPQVVKTLPDGTKAVCYEMLVGLLIEALKEQNAKVAQLENDVNGCCNKKGSTENRLSNTESATNVYAGGSYIKQNVPNPFNKETNIEYFIAERNAASSILVFDMNGKLLRTYKLNGNGMGNLIINGNDLTPGMYYYSLVVNAKEVGTKKMILTE